MSIKAVRTDAVVANAVVLRRLFDHCLVRQVGAHRVRRIPDRHGGLRLGLRFKLFLSLFNIRQALGQSLILIAKLF
jgi:hypothetical protein